MTFCLPPHNNSSDPSAQSFELSQTQSRGIHCSPFLHKNSLLGQCSTSTRAEKLIGQKHKSASFTQFTVHLKRELGI